METDLDNSVVYKIFCKDNDIKDFYIGSTKDIKNRMRLHKSKKNLPCRLYKTVRENGSWENWDYEILENCNVSSRTQLTFREKHYYNLLKPTLNSITPINTDEERKEKRKPRDKRYYDSHRDIILKKPERYLPKKGS